MTDNMPAREYKVEEIRRRFLEQVWGLVDKWDGPLDVDRPQKQRLTGLAMDILSLIDKGNEELPSFVLATYPDPDDKFLNLHQKKNWYPENHEVEFNGDIGGHLEEDFPKYMPQSK